MIKQIIALFANAWNLWFPKKIALVDVSKEADMPIGCTADAEMPAVVKILKWNYVPSFTNSATGKIVLTLYKKNETTPITKLVLSLNELPTNGNFFTSHDFEEGTKYKIHAEVDCYSKDGLFSKKDSFVNVGNSVPKKINRVLLIDKYSTISDLWFVYSETSEVNVHVTVD